jgi:arabinofuranosyltransferase
VLTPAEDGKGPGRWVLLVGAALPLALLAFSHVRAVDDAYIVFRYAHNLAEGEGLVFNPGERVEGYTSLLWTLAMALPEFLSIPTYQFATWLGLVLGLLALLETWRTLRILDVSPLVSGVAVATLGLYPEFWQAITMGLEGGLFAFLLILTVRLLVSGSALGVGVCGGLLFMTRPESVLFLPVCTLFAFLCLDDRERRPLQHLFALLVPWLALIVAVTLWRLTYYGEWLPNTISAKSIPTYELTTRTLMGNTLGGVTYWAGFLWSALPLSLGAAFAIVLSRRRLAIWLCLGLLATQIPVVFANGGDWMDYYRLLSVYAPLLTVLLGLTLQRLAHSGVAARVGVGLLFAGGVIVMLSTHEYWDITPDATIEKTDPCWQLLSDELGPALFPSDVVAPEVLGLFAYEHPDVYVHDLMGLTDREVVERSTIYVRLYGQSAPAYTYHKVRPDLVLVHSGFGFLTPMARVSKGTYKDHYSTYSLQDSLRDVRDEQSSCARRPFLASIRKQDVPRFLPAIAEFKPQRVTVPK